VVGRHGSYWDTQYLKVSPGKGSLISAIEVSIPILTHLM
jgi:hypothetical protein